MFGRIPAFQPGERGSIPGRVRDFKLYSGTGCVYPCVFGSGFVFDNGGEIVLTRHSGRSVLVYLSRVLIHSLLLALQAPDPWPFGL